MAEPKTKLQLQERAQLIRMLEAITKIDYPAAQELVFRLAIIKKLGCAYDLREMRAVEFVVPTPPKAAAPLTTLKGELIRR